MAIGIALAIIGSSANAGSLSSSYSFKKGHGNIGGNLWKHTYDHNNYVSRDWNGDGKSDVLSLTSAYSWNRDHTANPIIKPHAFLSRGDGSYKVQWVEGAKIHNLTTEWYGDYFSKRPIIVGNGNVFIDAVMRPLNCTNMKCVEFSNIRAVMHHVVVEDIDNDGKLDLITFKAGTSIFSNFQPGPFGGHPGNGTAQNLGVWSGNTGAFTGAFLDLDGDGFPEMITVGEARPTNHQLKGGMERSGGGLTVWKNHGGKNFTVMQKLPGGPGAMYGRLILKNGNDLLVYGECGDDCEQRSYMRVYTRSGGKLHKKQTFNIGARVGTHSKGHPPRLLDINGDGHKDLFVNHYDNYGGSVGTQHGGIWLNNGNGTFTRLGTPIFAGIPKAGMKGMLMPVHANGDGRLDWIVVYQDGTFGTLLSPGGGGGGSNNPGNGGGNTGGGDYADYVRGNGDLLAAYNRVGGNIEAWGKNHWERYGKYEPHRKNKPNTSTKIKVKDIVNGGRCSPSQRDRGMCQSSADGSQRFWQLGFVKDQLSVMNHSIINSNNVGFSFDDTTMFKGFEFGKGMSFNFGIGRPDEYGQVEDFVAGMSFGATDITVATDNTLLGWAPGQSLLNVSDTKSRYINIRRSKTIKDWTLAGNMTYALAQGNAGYGYVKGMDDFHAMGFGVSANYVIDEDSVVKFGVSQPLRIESGALHFDGVIADMTPDGREIDYTMSYTTTVSKSSTFDLQLSYASDYNHYRSEDNAKVMAVYKGTW